jgi:sugar lactone lactonase YvrE
MRKVIFGLPRSPIVICAFDCRDLSMLFITKGRVILSNQALMEYPLNGSLFTVEINPIGL